MSTPAANEPANEDGVESDEEQNATSSVITEFAAARHTVKDEKTPEKVTPPAPALPKPKPKLDKEDKLKLGEALAPLLKPSINNMSDQIKAAEKKPEDLHSVIGEGCVPQIESLAELITHERDKVVEDKEKKALAKAKAAAAAAEKERKAKSLTGYLVSTAMLKVRFARKHAVHLVASDFYHYRHQYFIFIPLQIVVMAIAVLAFVASHMEGNGDEEVAIVLTVIAGVLGIVAGFINALDRYLNYRSFADMHKSSASMFNKLKWSVGMSNITHIADGSDELEGDALKEIAVYRQKLQTLEESNGDLTVPLQLINVFNEVENLVKKKVEMYNDHVKKSVGMEKKVLQYNTSVRGGIAKAKSKYEPLIIDEVKACEIMISAYGFLVSMIQINKGWCCCSQFPFALPEPKSLTEAVLDKVGKEIDAITDAKFAEPTDKDYKTARNLMGSQGSDGSLAPKVREQAAASPSGAPPSADNNF